MLIQLRFVTVVIALLILPDFLVAQESVFFQGKTIRIIVGLSAGGGFDVFSRAIARHMGRYIPGNPTFIVDNMPGAGGRLAANHLYKVARPDGLTVGNFVGGLLVGQVLGYQGIEFEGVKFEYIGVSMKDSPVCVLTKASGITNYEQWRASKVPVKFGATGADDLLLYGIPKILHVALGLPVQVVPGYKGTSDIRLAAESGEVAGGCWGWEAIRSTWRRALETGDVNVVVQTVPKAHPELPKVPVAVELAKTEENRELIISGIHNVSAITRPYLLPPGTPKDRVQVLRRAFIETMKDPGFLAEIKKLNLEADPISGDELQGIINSIFGMSPAALARLKEAIK